MARKSDKKITRLWVTPEFKSFVLAKRAEDPLKYSTNYDVLDEIAGKKNNEKKKKRKGSFWGKI